MKKSVSLLLLFLVSLPSVLAANGFLDNIWDRVIKIGNLSFLNIQDGTIVTAFIRILIGILVFTIFFALLNMLGEKGTGTLSFFKRNQAIVVAAVLAIISAIFMPANVILAVGAGWATAISLVLIGGPVVGLTYLLWKIPGKDESGNKKPETKGTVLLKLILVLILFWVLSAMKYHVGKIA